MGTVASRVIRSINAGHEQITFRFEPTSLAKISRLGFSPNISQIRQLPGSPHCDFVDWEICFDPKAANLTPGYVSSELLIAVANGPIIPIWLQAEIVVPELKSHLTTVEFGEVQRGEARLVTVQLENPSPIPVHWYKRTNRGPYKDKSSVRGFGQVNLRANRKGIQSKRPPIFDVIPLSGIIRPKEKCNIQVKFTPLDHRRYEEQVVLVVENAPEDLHIHCRGYGLEPRLEFDQTMLQFDPCLPYGPGDERTVIVSNPCNYPIEFYSVEMDSIAFEQDQILRSLDGYDQYGQLLLPPRKAGEGLPTEILTYWEEQLRKNLEAKEGTNENANQLISASGHKHEVVPVAHTITESLKKHRMTSTNFLATTLNSDRIHLDNCDNKIGLRTMHDITPVSLANAHYLGLDISEGTRGSLKHQGIGIIVHGPLASIRKGTVESLAECYHASILSVDQVIMDALATGSGEAATLARECCAEAGRAVYQEALRVREIEMKESKLPDTGEVPFESEPRKTSDVNDLQGETLNISDDRTELCGGEEPVELREDQLYSVVLPEDLVVCLLKERFAQEDCFKGVIVNGLESQFTESHQKTAQLVLRAFEERQFIYAVTVRAELAYLKALEEEMEAKSSMAKEAENIARREWALQLDEFEYSLLTEDEQRMVDELRTKQRREIRRRELEAKRRRDDQEREEREAEARRLELERMNKRKGKKMEEKVVKPPLQLPAGEAKDTRGTSGRPASRATLEKDRSLKGTLGGDFGDASHLTAVDRRRASKSSDRKRRSVTSIRDETLAEETEESMISTEDKVLCQCFKTFNAEFPGICDLFSTWDRIAQAQRLTTGLDESNELAFFSPNLLQPPNARKNKQVSAVKPKKSVVRSDTSRTDGTHGDTISDALNPLPPIYCDNLPSDNGVGSVLSELTSSKPALSERTSYMSKPPSHGLIGLGVPHLIADAQLNATPHVVQDIKQEVGQALASISVLRPVAMQDEADVLQSHQWTDHDAAKKGSPVFSVLTAHLPNPEDILEHLGIGSKGPPIPAPVNFSVIQYPPARTAPMQVHSCAGNGRSSGNKSPLDRGEAERNKSYRSSNTPNEESNPALKNLQYFQFLYSGQGDPKMGDGHTTDSMSTLIDDKNSEALGDLHSSKSALRTTRRERKTPRSDLIDHGRKTSVVSRGHSVQASVPIFGLPSSTARGSILQCYRWLVPSKDQIRLRIRFRSDRVGQFDQLLNFEIVGTRRLYQIYCRGICALPTISREPRVLEGYFPENQTSLTLVNNSPLSADIRLGFMVDTNEDTFSVSPRQLLLKPGESGSVTMWAFPRTAKRFEDSLVCSIKDNPKPIIFKVACDGTLPELILDRKTFNFERVLLQRKEVRSITLRNPTLLPVQWKLAGVDALGEEFSVPQDAGIVEPKSEFVVYAYFRAMKPFKTAQKKSLRLEVYDMDNLAGLIQADTIQVIAEAYDVALDISFPRKSPQRIADPGSVFTVTPSRINLGPSEKAAVIVLSFCSKAEYVLEDEPVLRCQVIEPNAKGNAELIASIPIKLSIRALFSKFTISPSKQMDFGAIIVQHRKSRQLLIENKGEHDFRFSILRMSKMKELVSARDSGLIRVRASEMALLSSPQSKLQLGFFTITPASGTVSPNNTQLITVECSVETRTRSEEELAIEITDRDSNMYRYGIPYTLIAEGHIPSIVTKDHTVIFEEHRICQNLQLIQREESSDEVHSGGVYGVEENCFLFTNALVGARVRARFCIANRGQVPAEVSFEIVGQSTSAQAPTTGRSSSRSTSSVEAFELDPEKAQIDPHSVTYVNVTFTPSAMQVNLTLIDADHVFFLEPVEVNSTLLFLNPQVLPDSKSSFAVTESQVFSDSTPTVLDVESQFSTAGLLLRPNAEFAFNVYFRPKQSGVKSLGQIKMVVVNNPYEDTSVELIGESLADEDDVFHDQRHFVRRRIDNRSLLSGIRLPLLNTILAMKHNELDFGDCSPNDTLYRTFTLVHGGEPDSTSFRFSWPTNHPTLQFKPAEGHLHPGRSKRITVVFKPGGVPVTLQSTCVKCVLHRIRVPISEGCEQFQESPGNNPDVTHHSNADSRTESQRTTSRAGSSDQDLSEFGSVYEVIRRKQKLTEVEPEPTFEEYPYRTDPKPIDLLVSATADFAQYTCDVENIRFRDTMMFQRRIYRFELTNCGLVTLNYIWTVNMLSGVSKKSAQELEKIDTNDWEPDLVPFTVSPSAGEIFPGKSTFIQVTFEFTAITIGLIESFWRLSVDDLQVTVPLLVVCNTREPLILFERSCVRLHPVLVGHTVHETLCLINQECNDAELLGELARGVPFCFVESSCYGVGRQDCVTVEPMAGVIEPSNRCPIKISFTAKAERLLNVNLICRVQYRQLPLTLNIKAEGFTISTSAWLQNIGEGVSNLELTPLWSPCSSTTDPGDYAEDAARHLIDHPKYQSKLHPLDFGTVQPGECVSRKITIMNSGKFKCDFSLRMISLCKSSVRSTRLFNLLVNGVNEKNLEPVLHLDRNKGSLSPGEKTQCSVMFSPPKNSTVFPGSNIRLAEHSIACLVAIREGPAYGLSLAGCTSGQTVHFSPGVIDFGPQILAIKGISSAKRYLTLRNTDAKRPVSVECLTPDCAVFKQSLEPTILQSRSSGSDDGSGLDTYRVEITFTPQVCQQYEKELVFEMNGSMQQSILVRGEGADLVVDNKPGPLTIIRVNQPISQDRVQQILPVPDTCVKNRPIHIGTLQPNQRSRRFVTLINRSSAQICIHRVSLNQTGNGSVGVSRMASSLTDTKTTTSALAGTLSAVTLRLCQPISEDHQTSMAPISEVKAPVILKPKNGQIMVEINFTPSKRLPSFTREVLCEISAYDPESLTNGSKTSDSDREPKFYLPVFSVQGACRTYDIQLDKSSISFGPVVQGSQLTKSLTLLNHGDLGSKFLWLADTFSRGLSISPTEGFIEAGTDVPFTVTLSPTELDPDIRMENVTCQLQGCEPLKLIITAMCTPPAVMKDVVLFSTMVRQKDTRTLQIANRTNAVWELRPVIDSEHWTGAQVFTIQPQETNSYEVTYHPLTMTTEGRKHKGTLFFPLPDGNGLLYNLSGTSDPPKPLVKISREVECKLTHTEVISVPNWLCQAQRFRVTREIVRTEKADPNTSLKGLDYIDVPADGSRDYKLSFLSYREGTVYARVTFTNDQTGEYQFCEITFKIMRPKSLGTIQMRSPARKSVVKSVRLENPLNVPVSLSLSTTPSEVQCPNLLQVPPNCEASVTLEFCPLRAGSFTGRLDASCSELGVLSYDLELEATPAGPEPVTYFEASIGQRHTRTVRFCNGAKVKTEFLTKLDNSDFQCDRQVNAAPGVEVNLEVTFEPTVVGTRFSQLIVTSLHAGDYVFPLQGLAIEPRPQGPIVIRAGETMHITIRNVFQSAMLYSFQASIFFMSFYEQQDVSVMIASTEKSHRVDNTAFNLPKQNEVIRARKEYRIAVGLDASIVSSGIRAPVTGKLIVTCIQAETTTRAPAAKRTGSNEPDAIGLSVARSRKPGLTEGMQWVYYLRGVSS
ncbi:Hydrocephalus-inducing protein [Fasciola gigantica]|uniref:Hydrocephalus-inducing protein n=1 Tax=Fasciola gigantica TaxID=46835 RepID=A0A504Y7Q2_FASGI|nr:Hydrocephalus-inducing protein [Fasciola gigantica]